MEMGSAVSSVTTCDVVFVDTQAKRQSLRPSLIGRMVAQDVTYRCHIDAYPETMGLDGNPSFVGLRQ